MQHNVEETPPFPVDHSRTAFRLSARPTYNPYNEPGRSDAHRRYSTIIDTLLPPRGRRSTRTIALSLCT